MCLILFLQVNRNILFNGIVYNPLVGNRIYMTKSYS